MLVILGREIGFTLTLAGIAGFIVAVGITADSFVVFFERIKDEVHEGRSMRVAVPRAWVRARRTILSADTVSFLAAAILYYFAAGDVKGFAFTLGLSTILDLVVVFLFTHPLVSLLSRSAAFGSARFTGLDSAREGGVVKSGRGAAPGGTRASRSRSSVAVLEPEVDEPLTDDDELDGIGDTAIVPDVHRGRTGPRAPTRVHRAAPSPPVEGATAAERAAARRARMRGKPLQPSDGDADDDSTDADTDGQN